MMIIFKIKSIIIGRHDDAFHLGLNSSDVVHSSQGETSVPEHLVSSKVLVSSAGEVP